MGLRTGSTQADRDAEIVASYRQYIRMGLGRSAKDLLTSYPDLLNGIDPHSVLRDAEKGIK